MSSGSVGKSGVSIQSIYRPDVSLQPEASREFVRMTSGSGHEVCGVHGFAYGLGDIQLQSSFARQLQQEKFTRNPTQNMNSEDMLAYSTESQPDATWEALPRPNKANTVLKSPVHSSGTFYSPKLTLLNEQMPSPKVKKQVQKYAFPQHHPLYHGLLQTDLEKPRGNSTYDTPIDHILKYSSYAPDAAAVVHAPITANLDAVRKQHQHNNIINRDNFQAVPCTNALPFQPNRLGRTMQCIKQSEYHTPTPYNTNMHHYPKEISVQATAAAPARAINNVCARPRCMCECGDANCHNSFTPNFVELNKHAVYTSQQSPAQRGKQPKQQCTCQCDVNCGCNCMGNEQECMCGMKKHSHQPDYLTKVGQSKHKSTYSQLKQEYNNASLGTIEIPNYRYEANVKNKDEDDQTCTRHCKQAYLEEKKQYRTDLQQHSVHLNDETVEYAQPYASSTEQPTMQYSTDVVTSPLTNRAGVIEVKVRSYTSLEASDKAKDSVVHMTDRALLISEREKALLQWQTAKHRSQQKDNQQIQEKASYDKKHVRWDTSQAKDFKFSYKTPDTAYGPNSSSNVQHAYTPKDGVKANTKLHTVLSQVNLQDTIPSTIPLSQQI